jgi:hypothetical protein
MAAADMTIFVSIAAYRDPELGPTIEDCLKKARWPDALRFGVCWQHGPGEPPPPKLSGGRMRVRAAPWQESRGACWARAECMKLYGGEDFFLQIDSHHRFAEHWDAVLLDQAERSGSARPVITAYAPAYVPGSPLPAAEAPTVMRLDRFSPEGIPLYQFFAVPEAQQTGRPIRTRFVSAHLLFTLGSFVGDVPYDPELYFIGEEISLAVRAFTHGYDLYHPGAHVLWHEYTRSQRPKHWDDHVAGSEAPKPWHELDKASLEKVHRLLTLQQVGPFGLGTARTLAAYEAYAGLNFRSKRASRAARQGEEPAPPALEVPDRSRAWIVRCEVDREVLPPGALDRPLFWYVGFHDAGGDEIARDDADRLELLRVLSEPGERIVIERSFVSPRQPASWTIWPADRFGRWQERIQRPIDDLPATASMEASA